MAAAAVIIMMGSAKKSPCVDCNTPLTQGEHELLGYTFIFCVMMVIVMLYLMWKNRNK